MRKAILAVMLSAALAPAALAADARAEDNVIEFELLAVTVPAKLPNYCTVSAVVLRVWEGRAYRLGQPIALDVPCAEYGLMSAKTWFDGFTPVNARTLQQSNRGIARLDDKGELIWQHANLRQYGPWGAVWGYRVLDARMIPVQQRS